MNILNLQQFIAHFQGHRRLTIRTLQAFPEDQLLGYRVEPMRTFAEMAGEILALERYTLHGIISGNWAWQTPAPLASKQALVSAFELQGQESPGLFGKLSSERLEAVEKDSFGARWANRDRLLYMLDNEIHHRAQGYVYLRLLGIEPPAFWER